MSKFVKYLNFLVEIIKAMKKLYRNVIFVNNFCIIYICLINRIICFKYILLASNLIN